MLRAETISYKLGQKHLVHETSVLFQQGCFHVIMGANGAGKSTLLKLLAGDQKPSTGEIYLDEKNLHQYSRKQLATKRAVLSQHYNITFPISVSDIVLMGRYPYYSNYPAKDDLSICEKAMQLMDVYELRERDYNTLSGGEAQKVQMSRVLAQIWNAQAENRKFLFLDEPVSHLDIKYQHQLLKAAKDLCHQYTTVIAILHDINLAITYADRILFMKQGSIMYDLTALTEVSTEIIHDVFDVGATILQAEGHKPIIVF